MWCAEPKALPHLILLVAAAGCSSGQKADSAVSYVSPEPRTQAHDWTDGGVPSEAIPEVRDHATRRGIVHLHSPWSHDACDGRPLDDDGAPDADCLAALRRGLCAAQVDVAWLTDHPAHAVEQDFLERLHVGEDDELVRIDGREAAVRWSCGDSTSVLLRPGLEDELMPLGMTAALSDSVEQRTALANDDSSEAIATMRARGALVAVAHTEGRSAEWLERVVQDGVGAVELFNIHAAFDPGIRQEDLGLEGLSWAQQLGPFTDPASGVAPDLLMLTVLQAQTPSLAHWDALLQAGHSVVATGGTDAHQNVLPAELPDGERGDSFRRMLRWMSHHIRVPAGTDGDDPAALQELLAAGRFSVVFELLGTPADVDLVLETDDGRTIETGESGPGGTLVVGCPRLATGSPRSEAEPEVVVRVVKNGQAWAEGCGEHATDGPGAYRVEVEQVPHHLDRFLGDVAEELVQAYPWVYTQAIRVES